MFLILILKRRRKLATTKRAVVTGSPESLEEPGNHAPRAYQVFPSIDFCCFGKRVALHATTKVGPLSSWPMKLVANLPRQELETCNLRKNTAILPLSQLDSTTTLQPRTLPRSISFQCRLQAGHPLDNPKWSSAAAAPPTLVTKQKCRTFEFVSTARNASASSLSMFSKRDTKQQCCMGTSKDISQNL